MSENNETPENGAMETDANEGAGSAGNSTADATLDSDDDGLNNLAEYQAATNPFNSDSDNDGLTDAQEVNQYNSNPLSSDSDGDGLTDWQEVIEYGTDPLQAETILQSEQADLIAIAREFLRDPHWTWRAANILGCSSSVPVQYKRALGDA